MFRKKSLKCIACCVIVTYISVCYAGTVSAGQARSSENSTVLAQFAYPDASEVLSVEEEAMIRRRYANRIRQIEANMNNWRGRRNTLMTLSMTMFIVGGGVMTGAETVRKEVEAIEVSSEQEQDDLDTALDVLNTAKDVGGGLLLGGGVTLVSYFIYTAIISAKQKRINDLQAELDTKFVQSSFMQSESESVKAVHRKIVELKKNVGFARTYQGLLTRLFLGSLLSGGLLVGLSTLAEDGIDKINVDENNVTEVAAREDALDKADSLGQMGLILLGASAASGVTSFLIGSWTKRQEDKINKMEDSLLYTMLERINIHPKTDGFVVLYSHEF